MHARVTTFRANLERADEGARIFQEGIPAIRDLKGFKDAVLLIDRASGESMTIALWADERAMQDSLPAATDLFRQAAAAVASQPERHAYEVIEHRSGGDRRFARVSSGRTRPEFANSQGNSAIIEAASRQPGYAGFLIVADRATGMMMGMSFWDSMEHLEASESGYYTREMNKSRDQFEDGVWTRRVYEVAAQA